MLSPGGAEHSVALVPDESWDEQWIGLGTCAAVTAAGHRRPHSYDRRQEADRVPVGAAGHRSQTSGASSSLGGSLASVHYLRAPGNSSRSRADLNGVEHAVLVGGSFIATEVAAAATGRGICLVWDDLVGEILGAGQVDRVRTGVRAP
ncbi:hypothetical protein FRP1_29070 (plasmid) [Pseudonocardia sp. EC080625-04]|uniref:hypothetical protein n=1 Tax=Pseudonocardia sp. EC080625-04 TaxID=1096868 RepID=UPI0006CB2389|nr:hypothetical protein [Pseudonocardia sp. EC080625-04]ALE76843.1 hypothetical protein FRP1_29070 [Pseudonocardia sp. EC080625-04]